MIRIRLMTEADLPLGLRLTAQAGWNQTEADWRRFLRLAPDGCFVAEWGGAAVGTTTCFVFGPVAWVAMVLVDEAARGRGIGTALMKHALAFADGRGVRSVRLDATPLGRPLYEKLGFVADYTLHRYEGVLPATDSPVAEVNAVPPERFLKLLSFDEHAVRAERSALLTMMYSERRTEFRAVWGPVGPVGYLWARPGAMALQIGPCVATRAEAGRSLFSAAQRRHGGKRVFIDVPLPNVPAVRAVEEMGLSVQRHLLRMNRGQTVRECVEMLWATSGPEKG